jgi:hypothetical protein
MHARRVARTLPVDRNADRNSARDLELPGVSSGTHDLHIEHCGISVVTVAQDYGSKGWGFESLRARQVRDLR